MSCSLSSIKSKIINHSYEFIVSYIYDENLKCVW